MRAIIQPSVSHGSVAAPPSKSMAHRLLVCAGLSHKHEPCTIFDIEESQDVLATIDCLNVLGAGINRQGNCTVVYGIDAAAVCENDVLPCRECGSTLRFFVPVCLLLDKPLTLTGSETLLHRPMGVYQSICEEQGLRFEHTPNGICVQGPLHAGNFTIPGNVSSQFVSGLLFALPLLPGNSTITLTGAIESKPYITMTLHALSLFEVSAHWESEQVLSIPGNQRYNNISAHVEGDYSNAAFLEALNYVGTARQRVRVRGLAENTLQGDSAYTEFFPLLQETKPNISLAHCPDLGPVLMAVAAANNGCEFRDCARLAIKESNRGRAMAQELAKFGARVSISADANTITVLPGTLHAPTEALCGHNDHRIVMALATLASVVGGTIEGAEAVNKSYPSYFERLAQLGVDVRLEDDHEMD